MSQYFDEDRDLPKTRVISFQGVDYTFERKEPYGLYKYKPDVGRRAPDVLLGMFTSLEDAERAVHSLVASKSTREPTIRTNDPITGRSKSVPRSQIISKD